MKLKNFLLVVLALALVVMASIAGTLAYLTDTASNVNVMVLGDISIEQEEYQREDITQFGSLSQEAIEPFLQGKELFPYVDGGDNGWLDEYKKVIFPDGLEAWLLKNENAIDKFVSVSNVGRNNAYVRTVLACEEPFQNIFLNINTTDWSVEDTGLTVDINGNDYHLVVLTYLTNGGILAPNEVAPYSLLQLALTPDTDKPVFAQLGDAYDVLVFSQAVQADGFDNAEIALNSAFGAITADNHPWTAIEAADTLVESENTYTIRSEEEFAKLAQLVNAGNSFEGKTVILAEDLDLAGKPWTPIGTEEHPFKGTFNGLNHTVANVYVSNEVADHIGLFGYAEDATITGISLKNASLVGRNYVGAILGYGVNTSVSACKVTSSTVIATEKRAGGVAGMVIDGTVTSCTVTATHVEGFTLLPTVEIAGWICGGTNGNNASLSLFDSNTVSAMTGNATANLGPND